MPRVCVRILIFISCVPLNERVMNMRISLVLQKKRHSFRSENATIYVYHDWSLLLLLFLCSFFFFALYFAWHEICWLAWGCVICVLQIFIIIRYTMYRTFDAYVNTQQIYKTTHFYRKIGERRGNRRKKTLANNFYTLINYKSHFAKC